MFKKAKFVEVTGVQEQSWASFLCWLAALECHKKCSQALAQEIEFFSTIRKRVEAQEFETDSLARSTIAFHLGVLTACLEDRVEQESLISVVTPILDELERK